MELAVETAIVVLRTLAILYPIAILWGVVLPIVCRIHVVAAIALATTLMLGPLLAPAKMVVARALIALAAIELTFKLLDYVRRLHLAKCCRPARGEPDAGPLDDGLSMKQFLVFLIPFPLFDVVYQPPSADPLPSRRSAPLRIIGGLALGISGFVMAHAIGQVALFQRNFALNHLIMLGVFVLTIESLAQFFFGLEKLFGFRTTPPIQFAFLARTPAEYWYRYNTRVHHWLDVNVFRTSGGSKRPIRGVWMVFLVSAVFHEIMFAIATSRLDGYQFSFFLLQAPMVLISRRLNRFANRHGLWGDIVARSVTIFWLALSSLLFFHGVDRVFSFYYASQPWLP